jgi:hypothetical protein
MSPHARRPVIIAALLVAFVGLSVAPASAADETSEQKVQRLEQEVEVLKQKVEVLSKAVAELRAKLDVQAPQPAVTGAAPSIGPAVTAPTPATPGASSNPLRARPLPANVTEEKKEPKVPTYATFQQLLSALPSDLKPDPRTGWDAATADKARQWFKENVVGHMVKTRLALDSRQVGDIVRREPAGVGRAGDEKTFYRLDLTFTPQRFTYRGMLCEGRVLGEDGQAVAITVDQAFTRRASLLQPGQLITVEGKIKSIEMPVADSIHTTLNVLLTDYTVLSFKR